MKQNLSIKLTESAIMIALATILSLLKVIDMPFGGSVTAFSMLPIAVIAFRYGVRWGTLAAVAYGVMQMLLGMGSLAYATSAWALITIILFDYIIAFAVIGLAGVFRNKIKNPGTALALGTLITCVLRFICHVISGCTVWMGVSIPTTDGLLFSIVYNSSYMIPETLLTVVGAYFAASIFTLKSEKIKRIAFTETSSAKVYGIIPIALAITISFVFIFGMFQSEDGFAVENIATKTFIDWLPVIITVVLGIIASFSISILARRNLNNNSSEKTV